jgi:hypothetical protein
MEHVIVESKVGAVDEVTGRARQPEESAADNNPQTILPVRRSNR